MESTGDEIAVLFHEGHEAIQITPGEFSSSDKLRFTCG